jgi:hypothetical protein
MNEPYYDCRQIGEISSSEKSQYHSAGVPGIRDSSHCPLRLLQESKRWYSPVAESY